MAARSRASPLGSQPDRTIGSHRRPKSSRRSKCSSGLGERSTRWRLSIHQDRVVLLVRGEPPIPFFPRRRRVGKRNHFGGDALLIGHADAVDQAFQRLLTPSPLSELASKALERQADSEFWMVASAKIAGPEAVGAGVKLFW